MPCRPHRRLLAGGAGDCRLRLSRVRSGVRLRGNHHGPRPRGGTDGRSRHIGTLTVGLVGCASQKLRRPAPARELYASELKASAYAETTCDRGYILSTKHGLVHPDAVLEP